MPRVRIFNSNETFTLLAVDPGGGYVQSVQVRWPDKTEAMVLNLYTYAAQVVGRFRQAWIQSQASCGEVSIKI